jgi:hypothetical protein
MNSEDWYERIEPEIRELVRLCRNNGFNTTCSCGHEMYIEFDLGNNLEEVEDLARFLQEHYKGPFYIEVQMFCSNEGLWIRRCQVHFGSSIGVRNEHASMGNEHHQRA